MSTPWTHAGGAEV